LLKAFRSIGIADLQIDVTIFLLISRLRVYDYRAIRRPQVHIFFAWRSARTFSDAWVINLIGAGVAVSLLADVTLNIVLPTHTDNAGILLTNVGLMLAANRIIRIFINSPYGVLIERLPRRSVLVPSLFVGGLHSQLYTIPGFWPLLIARLVWGLAWAGIWIGANTVVLDLAQRKNRGRLVGRLQMWFPVGVGLSGLLGGWLTDTLGYGPNFRVESAITLAMAVVWLLFLPETRPEQLPAKTGTPAPPTPNTSSPRRQHLAPIMIAIVLMGLNWMLMIGGLLQLLPVLLEQRMGAMIPVLSWVLPVSTLTGILVALNQVLGFAASPLSGWFTDRTGNRWLLVVIGTLSAIFALTLGVGGVGLQLVVASMLAALTSSIFHTQIITLLGDRAGANQQGRLLGILNTAGDVGGALGPLLVFALLPIIDTSGVLTVGLVPLLFIFPFVLWVALREMRPAHQ